MNSICLLGRATKDVELRKTTTGKEVATITLAYDKFGKDSGTNFIDCSCFGNTAIIASKYVVKGKQIAIQGRLESREYDSKDGRKIKVWEVIVNNLDFTGNKTKSDSKQESDIDEELPF